MFSDCKVIERRKGKNKRRICGFAKNATGVGGPSRL